MEIKRFKKTYKFICNDCGEFLHTKMEFCEKCGSTALRKTTREDYSKYETKGKADKAERVTERKAVEKAEKAVEKADRAEKKAEKNHKPLHLDGCRQNATAD